MKQIPSVPIPPSRIEVAVNTAYEQSPVADEPLQSIDGQLGDKPQILGHDDDLERAAPWRPGSGYGKRGFY